jgi:hypothetical protein
MRPPKSRNPGPADSDPLYQAPLAVEQDAALNAEMAEWEAATVGDGPGDVADGRLPSR